jgi:hypothetical protein
LEIENFAKILNKETIFPRRELASDGRMSATAIGRAHIIRFFTAFPERISTTRANIFAELTYPWASLP